MLYSYIFTCYILVRMIDAADPEKLIFQKALLLAFDQKKTLLLKQNHIKGQMQPDRTRCPTGEPTRFCSVALNFFVFSLIYYIF